MSRIGRGRNLRAPVDADADFFAVGGDSLTAAMCVRRLRAEGLTMSIREYDIWIDRYRDQIYVSWMYKPSEVARMRLRVRVHAVYRQAQLHRVIMMRSPLPDTCLTTILSWHCGALTSNRADLLRIGALFRLAAISPHSAVYLPLRANKPTEATGFWIRENGAADLVIVRSDALLRPSDWPEIRARLRHGPRPGVPHKMLAPAPRPLTAEMLGDWTRPQLSVAEYAETVFVRASPRDLHEAGDLLTMCGDDVAVNKDIHRFGGPALLSVLKGRIRRTGRQEDQWECDILAEDPRFQHKERLRRPHIDRSHARRVRRAGDPR